MSETPLTWPVRFGERPASEDAPGPLEPASPIADHLTLDIRPRGQLNADFTANRGVRLSSLLERPVVASGASPWRFRIVEARSKQRFPWSRLRIAFTAEAI